MAKVLYVDADPARSEVVCRLLCDRGHRVTVAVSAERAMIQVEKKGDYDAVVLHLVLHGIDGAELCRWLQQWSTLSAAPRLVFTTHDTNLNLDLETGMPSWLPADRYLHAVEDLAELVDAVDELVYHTPESGVSHDKEDDVAQ
jgi:CheY-like chemotaxis protein